jgi:biopolymer transport protein ExbD
MGMSAGGGGGGDRSYDAPSVSSDINVTPLVDVMLVLLIIFMVVTPALLQGFQAVLPVGNNLAERPEEESRVVVGIDVDGKWYFNKRLIQKEQMYGALTSAFAARPEDKVLYLKADAGLPYEAVLEMMDVGRDAGARVLAAVSEQTPEAKEKAARKK